MNAVPSELDVGGVFLPPLLIASLLGLGMAWASAHLLNRFRLSRWFAYPPSVFVALAVLYTIVIGTFVVPI
ncbi:MAG: DUF1656 domain-containing protein [Pseudomonadota bacterium]